MESFFRRDALLHVYELGDLDDYFWPQTTWYGLADGRGILAVALLYSGLALPTLLWMGCEEDRPHLERLLRSLLALLPARFYCHLSCGLADVLKGRYYLERHGLLYLSRGGCQWRAMPHDFPPWPTACGRGQGAA